MAQQMTEIASIMPDLPPAAQNGTVDERREAIAAHITDLMCSHYAELFYLAGYLYRINVRCSIPSCCCTAGDPPPLTLHMSQETEYPELAKKQKNNDQAKRWLVRNIASVCRRRPEKRSQPLVFPL
jgi:hypothetical protein